MVAEPQHDATGGTGPCYVWLKYNNQHVKRPRLAEHQKKAVSRLDGNTQEGPEGAKA